VGGDRKRQSGVVIEPEEDLGIHARRPVRSHQPVVSEVCLPALVGLIGNEADVRRSGASFPAEV
jgi:hypothetical protein